MNLFDQFFKTLPLKNTAFTDMTEELFCIYVRQLLQADKNVLIVASSLMEANKLYRGISNYTDAVYLFPMDDFLTSEAIAISPDLMVTRLETLQAITSDLPCIVITNLMGYLRFLPTKENFLKSQVTLTVGMEIKPIDLISNTMYLGYTRQTIVTQTGEVGIRGFVIDIFPLGEDHPLRIEFFGDTIESLRFFDENTQKSLHSIDHIVIEPFTEVLIDNLSDDKKRNVKYFSESLSVANIGMYFSQVVTIYKDIENIKTNYENLIEEIHEYQTTKDIDFKGSYMFALEELYQHEALHYMSVNNIAPKGVETLSFHSYPVPLFNDQQEAIEKFLRQNLKEHKTTIICLKDYQLKTVRKNLNFPLVDATWETIQKEKINLITFEMANGFGFQDYVFLTANELFHSQPVAKKYKTKFKYGSKISDLTKLEVGDYVVHQTCGIGIYNGLKTLKQGDFLKDYLEVLYQGNDKLYIPVEKIELLSKYTGKEGVVPKIYKLGSNQWEKVKSRVRSKIEDMAAELLHLQAIRESQRGFAFSKDTSLQQEFEQAFPYTPTPDQLLAVEQIKEDMEALHPMDRLLVGDVGYGKTEVAFRAIFKAIMDNKQVLLLCPTTILSNQHYENAIERFKDFPVNIGLLNRFTTPKEKKRILMALKEGMIDLVIGTHRILSDDVKPKDLGLLVIDEEQRFGVKHKEKIKTYKQNVDVLTLTATPIPRTLQMSIVGLRSLSMIETPPVDRYPIQTYVIAENQQLIREAIYKELSREGQVFLLFNHVDHIETKVKEIKNLVPEANVIYAHGQMDKLEIEERMQCFIQHEADVLVCTTIIETGIDIPNVNTLIILDADCFGLSQLYQIRGRVGRSNKIAYCYLMYRPNRILTESAMKRLKVIREFTELGSGFSIATRDLSIRGAGDILGSEQAGFIDSIGIDLYLKMLNQEVERLKGTVIEEKVEEETSLAPPTVSVSTHISDQYVADMDLKIEIHRLINTIDSQERLKEVEAVLTDRFGKLTEEMLIYMHEEWFESMVLKIPVTRVRQTRNSIELYFDSKITARIDTEALFLEAFSISTMFRFRSRGSDLTIILDTIKLPSHPIYYLTSILTSILQQNNFSTLDEN